MSVIGWSSTAMAGGTSIVTNPIRRDVADRVEGCCGLVEGPTGMAIETEMRRRTVPWLRPRAPLGVCPGGSGGGCGIRARKGANPTLSRPSRCAATKIHVVASARRTLRPTRTRTRTNLGDRYPNCDAREPAGDRQCDAYALSARRHRSRRERRAPRSRIAHYLQPSPRCRDLSYAAKEEPSARRLLVPGGRHMQELIPGPVAMAAHTFSGAPARCGWSFRTAAQCCWSRADEDEQSQSSANAARPAFQTRGRLRSPLRQLQGTPQFSVRTCGRFSANGGGRDPN